MNNYHEFKAWEYEMPNCEAFGFKWEDIRKIEIAAEEYNDLSGYVPSKRLSEMKERLEKKKTVQLGLPITIVLTIFCVIYQVLKLDAVTIKEILFLALLVFNPASLIFLAGVSVAISKLISPLEYLLNKKGIN